MSQPPIPQAPLPALKPGVEAIQIEHEKTPMILLKDTEGLAEKGLAVSMAGFFVASMLDGKATLGQIQAALTKTTGQHIMEADINNLIEQLDKAHLIESEALHELRNKVLSEFKDNPIRVAHHSKVGYPDDTLELASFLGKFFKDAKGPGKEAASTPIEPAPPLALISPHIDLFRGGPAYAHAYQKLSEFPAPDVIIGLGVAHISPNSPWVMTPKHYGTPYGPVQYDQDLYEKIKKVLWYDPRDDEWTHRTEHSLEFQALWLKYLWKEKTPAWVPILCSSFERFSSTEAPSKFESIEKAILDIGRVINALEAAGKTVMLLGGIDLAHVGPRFGDKEDLTPEMREKIKKEDKESIDLALELKADEFYLSLVKDGHWRKWCGLSALYTLIRLVKLMKGGKTAKGELLTYDHADDPVGGVVSFMSAIIRRP